MSKIIQDMINDMKWITRVIWKHTGGWKAYHCGRWSGKGCWRKWRLSRAMMDKKDPAMQSGRSRTSGEGTGSANSLGWERIWHVQSIEGQCSSNLCMREGVERMWRARPHRTIAKKNKGSKKLWERFNRGSPIIWLMFLGNHLLFSCREWLIGRQKWKQRFH